MNEEIGPDGEPVTPEAKVEDVGNFISKMSNNSKSRQGHLGIVENKNPEIMKETQQTCMKNNEAKPVESKITYEKGETPFKPDGAKQETTREKEDVSTKLPAISFNNKKTALKQRMHTRQDDIMMELQKKIKHLMVKSDDNKNRRNQHEVIECNESIIVNQQDPMDGSIKSINDNLQKNPIVGKPAPFFSGKGVVDREIKDISNNQFEGNYLLLFFMSEATLKEELALMRKWIDQFKASYIKVLGCINDSPTNLRDKILTPEADGGIGEC